MELTQIEKAKDKALILSLGGHRKVAEMLGYELTAANVQKVKNWLERGIPWHVKVKHGDVLQEPAAAAPRRRLTDRARA